MMRTLQNNPAKYDPKIAEVKLSYGPERFGDVPHSLAGIDKATKLLGYKPEFSLEQGLREAVNGYWENLK